MDVQNNKTENLVVVIFDGITNSVFDSQVLQPLLKRLDEDLCENITLVSFERSKPSAEQLQKIIPAHKRLHFALGRKLPFWGTSSLRFSFYQLAELLKNVPCDRILARGPFAGYISYKALLRNPQLLHKQIPVLVQARGLCAEEFRYAWQCRPKGSLAGRLLYGKKYRNFRKLEKLVYGQFSRDKKRFFIESVSPALSDYLVTVFGAGAEQITVAEYDKPTPIAEKQLQDWREQVRTKLSVDNEREVYCYSGSYKPWQCAPETISYFAQQRDKNSNSFLLILSQDAEKFEQELSRHNVAKDDYAVFSVNPRELLKYLAASDYGMLFRKRDVVNWVSRPTKMLEYQAAGLKIIHNDTIALLKDAK